MAILLKIYAKCLDGQNAIAKRRIKKALGDPARTAENFGRYWAHTAVEGRQGRRQPENENDTRSTYGLIR